MLTLILGRAGTGKSEQILRQLCARGAERPQVLIVPEQRSHETERALCAAGGPGVSLYAEVLSFSRLAGRIFQSAGGSGVTELDAGGRLLLMHKAVRQTASQLAVYRRPSQKAPFLKSLLDTVDELKNSAVPPELLVRAGQDRGGAEGDRLRDLGLLCGALGQILGLILLAVFKSPIFLVPGFIPLFFDNATIAIFANKFGGWKAAAIIVTVNGMIQIFGSALAVSMMELTWWQGSADYATIWVGIIAIFKFIGAALGIPIAG
jgi:hypothetical protein